MLDNTQSITSQIQKFTEASDRLRHAIEEGDRSTLIELLTLAKESRDALEVDVHDRQNDTSAQDLVTAANDLGFDVHSAHAATGWLIEGDMDLNEIQQIGNGSLPIQ